MLFVLTFCTLAFPQELVSGTHKMEKAVYPIFLISKLTTVPGLQKKDPIQIFLSALSKKRRLPLIVIILE